MQFEALELFKSMETRALIPMVLIQRVALTCPWKFHPSVASIPLLLLKTLLAAGFFLEGSEVQEDLKGNQSGHLSPFSH